MYYMGPGSCVGRRSRRKKRLVTRPSSECYDPITTLVYNNSMSDVELSTGTATDTMTRRVSLQDTRHSDSSQL